MNSPGPKDPAFFYPKEYYIFDNFSSFQVKWKGTLWPTVEHAFQAAKFETTDSKIYNEIKNVKSADEARRIAVRNKDKRTANWNEIKVEIMKNIVRHKINQHPYVLKKLIQSGKRKIIEDSWRDSQWGWGEDKKGKNLMGKIWMELRKEYLKK
ncbi:hypothetical protein A3D80_03670 [Candidatus Roizmanbacteria bacterium RIFCSPHIGHO2_02_FULL_40_13b]|uniref:NADAR domain-containing protein n=1 Tax=Candidatus Roizmanbacteria bacterium RIFCSPHIGHO2_01_FULL_39_24 TaxID=1802032 RepID=A0A1F7GJG9_9BACT|nr:MAG: hypothetical protein A2799_04140 [Candidatus Roizmanbacteria bacterium RIFCSPHIGHO2_01_FULL_39_24]OGK27077.1 MAG: hypothetical protein A3D80_03670 [Candidatus Roizmanbacteria bacterium RIFCSPHIGHO2_02_FULL_40_13b]OGK48914.1 MAG: hypothetical protein A3A56_01050 [Candidatus Roizmanbacteria bacterium RIFCSPLOWO2_01_FULL_40_32]OGK56852.1 MAG: hypothetical protein A3H83_01205 [Candidatus Roizmanbacteria bacterium RIFCSPLOWO2_02_FULL_39_8]